MKRLQRLLARWHVVTPLRCSHCERSFWTWEGLTQHVRRVHGWLK